jgi:hypothetical protein
MYGEESEDENTYEPFYKEVLDPNYGKKTFDYLDNKSRRYAN